VARPTKRTPEREQRLLDAVRAGNTRRASAAYAGVSEDSLERWQQRYAGFADALTRAEAEAEVRNVAIVQQAARDDWRAAAWWLERRRPEEYARRDRLEVSIRQQAERIANGEGLDATQLIIEAERIARDYG
jgi:hypothetical protein